MLKHILFFAVLLIFIMTQSALNNQCGFSLETNSYTLIKKIISLKDGNYLLLGNNSRKGENAFILKVDSIGNIFWQRGFGMSSEMIFYEANRNHLLVRREAHDYLE